MGEGRKGEGHMVEGKAGRQGQRETRKGGGRKAGQQKVQNKDAATTQGVKAEEGRWGPCCKGGVGARGAG